MSRSRRSNARRLERRGTGNLCACPIFGACSADRCERGWFSGNLQGHPGEQQDRSSDGQQGNPIDMFHDSSSAGPSPCMQSSLRAGSLSWHPPVGVRTQRGRCIAAYVFGSRYASNNGASKIKRAGLFDHPGWVWRPVRTTDISIRETTMSAVPNASRQTNRKTSL